MTTGTTKTSGVIRDLGDGLILRRARPDDVEKLIDFNARVHSDDGWDQPDAGMDARARDMLTRPHPACTVGDFMLVQHVPSGTIVSTLCLIPQTWSYAGIEFGVGQPELVGTHPDYRKRGLMRAQFDVVHRWSAERGHVMQVLIGIPWFYRAFGYEYGLEHDACRIGYRANIPRLKEGAQEPYNVRPTQRSDLDLIARLYDESCKRGLVSCVRDRAVWQYELDGRSEGNTEMIKLCTVETAGGEPVGFVAYYEDMWDGTLYAIAYELAPGLSWSAVTPSVLRYLANVSDAQAKKDGEDGLQAFALQLGDEHPVYDAIPHRLPRVEKRHAWYVRVPDVPRFVRLIGPVLEERLAGSPLVGHSGELTLGFYRDGVRLVFEGGRVVEVSAWQPKDRKRGMACFPDLTFLQLLLGYRSFDELDHAFADCFAEEDARPLVKALFPKQASDVWSVT